MDHKSSELDVASSVRAINVSTLGGHGFLLDSRLESIAGTAT